MKLNIIRNKSIQVDLIRHTTELLKATSCLDDDTAKEMNEIVARLDRLVSRLEDGISVNCKAIKSSKPGLTIV